MNCRAIVLEDSQLSTLRLKGSWMTTQHSLYDFSECIADEESVCRSEYALKES